MSAVAMPTQRGLDAPLFSLFVAPCERVAICGGPKSGKSNLALAMKLANAASGPRVRHTDDTIHLGWSEASAEVATWFDEQSQAPLVIEGVALCRAARKWLAANPVGTPFDRLVVLSGTFEPLSNGQAAMAKGINTVLAEIIPELLRRGVVIESARLKGAT